MLSFLAPLWFLGLPLVALPWLTPLIQQRFKKPLPFSAFFLLPSPKPLQRLVWSKQNFWLKLLRSILIFLFLLVLSKPVWKKATESKELWLIDDTLSAQSPEHHRAINQLLEKQAPLWSDPQIIRISELFEAPPEAFQLLSSSRHDGFHLSPSLAQIAKALLAKYPKLGGHPSVHLISDFQHSQYRFYSTATQMLKWHFYQPELTETFPNLFIESVNLDIESLFNPIMKVYVSGYVEEAESNIEILLYQNQKLLTSKSFPWKNTPETFEISIPSNHSPQKAFSIKLKSTSQELSSDNFYYWERNPFNNPSIGILTSEGRLGTYKHGLYPIKSALNANHYVSYLVANIEQLKKYQPDLLILHGDFPQRWMESTISHPSRLFIPSRQSDWSPYLLAESTSSVLESTQHFMDWSLTPFSESWSIQNHSKFLAYASTPKLWLLQTGVSSSWGKLYQGATFSELFRGWIRTILEHAPDQALGNYRLGRPFPNQFEKVPHVAMTPGVYRYSKSEKNYYVALNIPEQEQHPTLMRTQDVKAMQQYFDQQFQEQYESLYQESVWHFRKVLLWLLLGLLLIEILYSIYQSRQFSTEQKIVES